MGIVLFIGTFEITFTEKEGEPGNYGKGFLGAGVFGSVSDSGKRTRSLNAEIANGRLAMMAIIGMFYQDGLTGSAWGDWANYVDSPLRATASAKGPDFSSELGVCPPLGFWDPLALSKFEDPAVAAAQFKRRRVIEIQHGRV